MTIDDLSGPPANTIRLQIPASVVLALVKDKMPVDATVIAAGYDAATDRIELTIQSDFFKQSALGNG